MQAEEVTMGWQRLLLTNGQLQRGLNVTLLQEVNGAFLTAGRPRDAALVALCANIAETLLVL